jgi:catechol 2,3-dioxygenase-like lactoylglutathione lyase family enzyme
MTLLGRLMARQDAGRSMRSLAARNLIIVDGAYMATHVHLAVLLLLASLPLSAQTASAPAPTLFGQGGGLDHVGVLVRDMEQAQRDYEKLGFVVGKGGHFPGGEFNTIVPFQNGSYIEMLSVSDTAPTKRGMAAHIAEFLKTHEGAVFLGIDVSSAAGAADYLTAHGFDASPPVPGAVMKDGESTPPPPQYFNVQISATPAAGKKGITLPIFLIQHVATEGMQKRRIEGQMDHPNTALAIHAVWFAVHSVDAQLGTLRDAGFDAGASESRQVKFLGAHGQDVRVGQGVILLLEPSTQDGLLAQFLSEPVDPKQTCNCRGEEAIIGLSIEVGDLAKARRLAESGTGNNLELYEGFYGKSFLLPPEETHGVWIELYQRAEYSHGGQH